MSAIDAIGEYLEDVVYRSVCKAMTEVAPKTKVEEREEEEVYISIKQACEYLGIKTTTFYERLKGDSIRTKKEEGRRTGTSILLRSRHCLPSRRASMRLFLSTSRPVTASG